MLGRWWTEGDEVVLTWRDGRLRLELVNGPAGRNVSWLVPEAEDRWRIVEGRELGEVLRVVRDGGGAPVKLYVATYPLTRTAAAFGADASGMILPVARGVERDRDRDIAQEQQRAA